MKSDTVSTVSSYISHEVMGPDAMVAVNKMDWRLPGRLLCVPACLVISNSFAISWAVASRLLCPQHFPSKITEVGCHFLLQGIVSTHVSNLSLLCLLHQQMDSLPLSHLGSPNVYLFILVASGLSYRIQDLSVWHACSAVAQSQLPFALGDLSSLTRN